MDKCVKFHSMSLNVEFFRILRIVLLLMELNAIKIIKDIVFQMMVIIAHINQIFRVT